VHVYIVVSSIHVHYMYQKIAVDTHLTDVRYTLMHHS